MSETTPPSSLADFEWRLAADAHQEVLVRTRDERIVGSLKKGQLGYVGVYVTVQVGEYYTPEAAKAAVIREAAKHTLGPQLLPRA